MLLTVVGSTEPIAEVPSMAACAHGTEFCRATETSLLDRRDVLGHAACVPHFQDRDTIRGSPDTKLKL